jgi:methylglutaconyl-CoA hydratase
VVTVSLNRPQVRNTLDESLIAELTEWAGSLTAADVRVAILRGEGKAFCAGADLTWMARTVEYSRDENVRDARRLAAMFQALDTVPVPLIGRVHGADLVYGLLIEPALTSWWL